MIPPQKRHALIIEPTYYYTRRWCLHAHATIAHTRIGHWGDIRRTATNVNRLAAALRTESRLLIYRWPSRVEHLAEQRKSLNRPLINSHSKVALENGDDHLTFRDVFFFEVRWGGFSLSHSAFRLGGNFDGF